MIQILSKYGQMLLFAMGQTLLLALWGLFFACILGMIFGLLSVVRNKVCNVIASIFVDVIRGVPMIVLAYFIFFGLPYAFKNFLGSKMTLTALQAGTAALALNCGAYMAEIIRAGIQSDGGCKKSWTSILACHGTRRTSAGNPYHDPEHYQPVHHHLKGYFYSLRHRVPGTGQHRKKCYRDFL